MLMLARARARAGLFDSHALFSDILDRPAAYLNGTAPLNTTGAVDACVYALGGDASTARCTVATGSARDSFVLCVRPPPSAFRRAVFLSSSLITRGTRSACVLFIIIIINFLALCVCVWCG